MHRFFYNYFVVGDNKRRGRMNGNGVTRRGKGGRWDRGYMQEGVHVRGGGKSEKCVCDVGK